jgi:hypothetical protein
MKMLKNLKAKAKDLFKLSTCMYYENRAQSLCDRSLNKIHFLNVYLFEELRETIENHKMGMGFDGLADVNNFFWTIKIRIRFEDLRLQAGRSRVRFPMVSLEFFIDIIFPAAL